MEKLRSNVFLVSGLFLLGVAAFANATISCRFNETTPLDFCDWTPRSKGASWRTGSLSHINAPAGHDKYAFIHSGLQSWAYLESKPFTVSQSTRLKFSVIQQRFDPNGSADFVQLHAVPVNGQPETLLWAVPNSFPGWSEHRSKSITPEMGNIRLRFQFEVGVLDEVAALGAVVLEDEDSVVTPQPVPELPPIEQDDQPKATTDASSLDEQQPIFMLSRRLLKRSSGNQIR